MTPDDIRDALLAMRQERDRQIHFGWKIGRSVASLAKQFDLTERVVQNIARRIERDQKIIRERKREA